MNFSFPPALESFPLLSAGSALFLDLDGTLADITTTPSRTIVRADVLKTLSELLKPLDGALAIVSGRPIADIDRLCWPYRFTAAGQHGLELRHVDGAIERVEENIQSLTAIQNEITFFHRAYPQLLLEYKGLSLAVHYRQAPKMEKIVEAKLSRLVAQYPEFRLQKGKMVCEIRLRGADKGTAIQALLKEVPFKGKVPIFVGDDVTDEDGFRMINRLQGISIKIGKEDTCARHCMKNTEQFRSWLLESAIKLRRVRA